MGWATNGEREHSTGFATFVSPLGHSTLSSRPWDPVPGGGVNLLAGDDAYHSSDGPGAGVGLLPHAAGALLRSKFVAGRAVSGAIQLNGNAYEMIKRRWGD